MARGVMTVPIDHIDCWIFDLDNTLYHPSARLFDLIDARMGAFIMRLMGVDAIEARRVVTFHASNKLKEQLQE